MGKYSVNLEGVKQVVLYGVSEIGAIKAQKLASEGIDFVFSDTEVNCDEFMGIPVIPIRELYSMDRQTTGIFVYKDVETIYEKAERLKLAGFSKVFPCTPEIEDFYGIIDTIPNIRKEMIDLFKEIFIFTYEGKACERLMRPHNVLMILSKIERISYAYNLLEDDLSKKTFINILKYRVTGKTEYLTEYMITPQYFMDGVYELTDHEVYVDAGAAQGDTIIKFASIVNNSFEKIYAFEAKNSYVIGMKQLFSDDERIKIIDRGLYSTTGNLYFHENEHGSFVSTTKESNDIIAVTSIDDTISEPVSFIKMDIEGSEIPALDGAVKMITQNKPKLAICAYHLEDDLWEVPIKIKSLVPEYKVYMRHHYAVMDEETVCYASV